MWGAIISTVGSLAGGMMGNAASAAEAARSRGWSEYMSNTAHQREVADLRAAGLNPILSATRGAGASTPNAAVAQQSDVLTPAINSGLAAYNAGIDAELKKSQEFKQGAETAKIKEETLNTREELQNIQARKLQIAQETATAKELERKYREEATHEQSKIRKTEADRQQSEMMTDLLEKQKLTEDLKQKIMSNDVVVARAAAKKAVVEGKIDETTYGKIMRYIDRATKAVSPFIPKGSYKVQ